MPILDLTDGKESFVKLGNIRKGDKDESGKPRDLDYFRVTFMNHPRRKMLEETFRQVYGERPTSINVRFAYPYVNKVWDAFYECYKAGGLYAKVGSTLERGLYWVFYRDPHTAEVWISGGSARTKEGHALMAQPIDLNTPIYYSGSNNKPNFLSPVGRLEVVIPELAEIAVGYFEFRPESPRDIRNITAELNSYFMIASQYQKNLLGIPFKLFRREETVPKRIGSSLSKGPSWVVHIETGDDWGAKALAVIDRMALPEVVEGEIQEVIAASVPTPDVLEKEETIQEDDAEKSTETDEADDLVDVLGLYCVDYAAVEWETTRKDAAIRLGQQFEGRSKVKRSEFLALFNPEKSE